MSKDNNYVFNILRRFFEARQFQKIPTDTGQVHMFATFQKSRLYLVNLILLDDTHTFDSKSYGAYRETTRRQFEHVETDQVVLLNLIITNQPSRVDSSIDVMPDLDADFIDVHWIVDSVNRQLIIMDNQLRSVLGLEKPIETLIRTGEATYVSLARRDRHEWLTFALMAILVGVWGFTELAGGSMNVEVLVRYGAMSSPHIQYDQQYWRLVTAIFLHAGVMHLIFNLFGCYIFSSRLEKYMTRAYLLFVFIGSGIIGNILSYSGALMMERPTVAVGASGAIYGLIGSILLLTKASHRPIEGLNAFIIGLFFLYGIVYSVVSPDVDAFAHVGGFIGGLLLTVPLIIKSRKQLGGTHEER